MPPRFFLSQPSQCSDIKILGLRAPSSGHIPKFCTELKGNIVKYWPKFDVNRTHQCYYFITVVSFSILTFFAQCSAMDSPHMLLANFCAHLSNSLWEGRKSRFCTFHHFSKKKKKISAEMAEAYINQLSSIQGMCGYKVFECVTNYVRLRAKKHIHFGQRQIIRRRILTISISPCSCCCSGPSKHISLWMNPNP